MMCKHGFILVEITHVDGLKNLDLNALPADVWEVVLAIGEQNGRKGPLAPNAAHMPRANQKSAASNNYSQCQSWV
jgi:hypothetical protein